jgi:hypothetical protein
MLIETGMVFCKDIEVQNLSINGRVFFLEEGDINFHEDDFKQ